jgi:hypothetical protein
MEEIASAKTPAPTFAASTCGMNSADQPARIGCNLVSACTLAFSG